MTVTDEAQAAPEAVKEIGRDRRRKEDQRLITGRTRWTDNIQLNGMLHLAMVRSPFAHAKITNIETEAAKAAPNVVTVVTGPDIADVQGILINAWPITPEQKAPVHTPVAFDRVASAGEIVAVCRPQRRRGADAAELVDADYDELPAALDLKDARADTGARAPRTSAPTSPPLVFRLRRGRHRSATSDDAIAKARDGRHLIEREYRQQRLIPAFMEPRSVWSTHREQITWGRPPRSRTSCGSRSRRPRASRVKIR
jgi:carbon-monoxide dehydrogenase large subunit